MCTKQEVRESITASLLGIRANVRSEKILSTETQQYVLIRCMDVREQLLVLLKRGDRRHVKTLMRILRSFEHTVAMMMNTDQSSDDVSSS